MNVTFLNCFYFNNMEIFRNIIGVIYFINFAEIQYVQNIFNITLLLPWFQLFEDNLPVRAS